MNQHEKTISEPEEALTCDCVCVTHRVDGVDQLAWFAELHEALSQVVQRSFHQNLLLLVVVQQVVPQRLLGQSLRVAHNDHAISACIHTYLST